MSYIKVYNVINLRKETLLETKKRRVKAFLFSFRKSFDTFNRTNTPDNFFHFRNYRSQSYIAGTKGKRAKTSGITGRDRSSRNDVRFQSFCPIVG